jgi:hypothetical protein
MEYFDAGSLGDLLAIRKKGFNEYQIQMIIAQVLRGLQYLHSLNLIHRDIKVCIRFALPVVVVVVSGGDISAYTLPFYVGPGGKHIAQQEGSGQAGRFWHQRLPGRRRNSAADADW